MSRKVLAPRIERIYTTAFLVLGAVLLLFVFPLNIKAATIDEQITANNVKIKALENCTQAGCNEQIGELQRQNADLAASKLKDLTVTILDDADKMCTPIDKKCGCGYRWQCTGGLLPSCACKPDINMYKCVCYQLVPNTSHIVKGICEEELQCRGRTYTNLEGKTTGVGDIGGIVGQIFKGLLDKVMGGGGGGAGGSTGVPAGSSGCTQYYQVTVPSTDPCAQYVPPTSGSLLDSINSNASSQLLDALNAPSESYTTPASVSSQIISQLQSAVGTNVQTTQSSQSSPILSGALQQAAILPSGTRGDIEVTGAGATIFASARDSQANTEVVGFYGADTLGTGQPQSLAARMCQNRPWAGSFISYVIPPTFFDGLCTWRGYTVGPQGVVVAPPPTPVVFVQQIPPAPLPTTTPSVVPSAKPEVDIWAVPEKVPLGARTSIFWNTRGAASCTVMSPDGSFSENTLSGGAATVPITGATMFTISCLGPDGSPATDYVTVNLAI